MNSKPILIAVLILLLAVAGVAYCLSFESGGTAERESLSAEINRLVGETDPSPGNQPLDFAPEEVAAITLEIPGSEQTLAFKREAPDEPFSAVGQAENMRVRDGELDNLLKRLLEARFSDVRAPDDEDALGARRHARKVTLVRFNGETYTLEIGRRPAEREARGDDTAEAAPPARIEASIIFDQDGNIVVLPEPEPEEEPETEMTRPGPVFIFYASTDPDFRWSRINEEAALLFADPVYEGLPESEDKLLEEVPAEAGNIVNP